MRLAYGSDFETDFRNNILANGQLSVTNNILKATGTASGDRAVKETHIPNTGNTHVKVTVMARAVNGSANIAIDATNDGVGYTNIEISNTTSRDWTTISLECIVPQNFKMFKVTVGRFAGDNGIGEAYYKEMVIDVDSAGIGSNIPIAQGMVRLQGGQISIRPAYKSFGIHSGTYDSVSKKITIYLEKEFIRGDFNSYPMIHITGTNDNPLIPLVGSFSGGRDGIRPRFEIQFSNGTAFVDVSALSLYFFVSVLL